VILIVKPVFAFFLAILFTYALAGCGQRGPLYLPAKPAPDATPTTQTQTTPVPADREISTSN
jgi:predicted small lipoprotein YifL